MAQIMTTRRGAAPLRLGAELLTDLYLGQGLTCRQIADRCGYASTSTVVGALARAGIATRNSRKRTHVPAQPKELLEELYVEQGKSARTIALELAYSSRGQVALDLKAYGIPIRPRSVPPPEGRPPMTKALLGDLYRDKGWSAARIAKETGYGTDAVRAALSRHEIPARTVTVGPESALTRGELERLHHRQGLTIAQIATQLDTYPHRISKRAAELGVVMRKLHSSVGASLPVGGEERLRALYARPDVTSVLKRHGVPRRNAAGERVHEIALHRRLLADLYTGAGLSSVEIGLLLARSSASVMRALRAEEIPLRPPPPPRPPSPARPPRPPDPERPPLTKELLEELYVRDNLTLREVAKRCGWKSEGPVRKALHREEIPLRRQTVPRRTVELTRELLQELYVTQGLSAPAIVEILGDYSATTIHQALKREGIATRGPRYTSNTPMPELSEILLRRLYVDRRLRVREIAERLGYARGAVSRALREHGIVVERRRGRPRQHRREFDRATLEELYVHRDLSAAAVGAELGVTGAVVLKRLHDYGMAVRRGPWEHATEGEKRLDRLRRDRRVRAALIQADIPPWRETGDPVPERSLPAEFLRKVYQEIGLSLFDIELLTARPSNSVRNDLVAAAIPVKPRLGYRGRKYGSKA